MRRESAAERATAASVGLPCPSSPSPAARQARSGEPRASKALAASHNGELLWRLPKQAALASGGGRAESAGCGDGISAGTHRAQHG